MSKLTGRELDAEVAEVVFGHKLGFKRRYVSIPVGAKSEIGAEIPRYSEDMGAAWLVMEKILQHNKALDFSLGYWKHVGGITWSCTISDLLTDLVDIEADTAQEAICLAALELFREKGDSD